MYDSALIDKPCVLVINKIDTENAQEKYENFIKTLDQSFNSNIKEFSEQIKNFKTQQVLELIKKNKFLEIKDSFIKINANGENILNSLNNIPKFMQQQIYKKNLPEISNNEIYILNEMEIIENSYASFVNFIKTNQTQTDIFYKQYLSSLWY